MVLALMIESSEKKVIYGLFEPHKKPKLIKHGHVQLNELPFLLKEFKGIKEVKVAIITERMAHKRLLLPPAKDKIIKELVRRELHKHLKGVALFKYQEIGETRVEGVRKKIYQAVGADSAFIQEIYLFLEKNGAKPTVLTTYPVAVRELLHRKYGREKCIAFVEINESRYITVIKGDEIRIVRVLTRKPADVLEEETDAIKKALLQTVFYHKQEFQGENIEKIVLAGRDVEKMKEAIETELHIDVEVFKEDPNLRLQSLIGLFYLHRKSCPFNLFPPQAIEKEKVKKTVAAGSVIIFILVACFAFRHAQLNAHLRHLNYFKKELENSVTKKEMSLKKLSKEFIAFQIEKGQPPWSEVLFELAALIPRRVVLTSFQVERNGEIFEGKAEGKVLCQSEIDGLELLGELKRRFALSPYFEDVQCQETLDEEGMHFELQFKVPVAGRLNYEF